MATDPGHGPLMAAADLLNARILVVDDQQANIRLLEGMLRVAGYQSVTSTPDPTAVCDLHRENRFDLILLDLQMPVRDGFQVMEELKTMEPEGYLPVLVVTARPDHKLRALKAGARDFVSKPFEMSEVLARVHNLLEVQLLHRRLRSHNEMLEQRVCERTAELQASVLETIYTMTRAAEYKDEETGAHVQRISYYSRELARMMHLDEIFAERLFFASPMHDIGKIGIPDRVLLKPGPLTPEEWQVMRGHTTMGAKILGASKSPLLQMGAEIALNHHERWNGGGYPHGRCGDAIPLSARIMNICDVYDALRSKRPYKQSFDHAGAMAVITRGDERTQPRHFDPAVFSVFAENGQTFGDIFDAHAN